MEIKSVELNHTPARKESTEKGTNGQPLIVPAQPEINTFAVTFEDDSQVFVPNEPTNRHYQEVAAWYKQQPKPPFTFDFVEAPKAE